MLKELRIENFAIIDNLEIQFGPGLSVLTGETGAGKSIIIDALETILGVRADSTLIRSGAQRAIIEASFRITGELGVMVNALLEDEDLQDDPEYVTLARELRRNGRNVARINGRSVNVSLVHKIGEVLVDIHGQSQHLSLLRVRQHLGLLDRYADIDELLIPYQKTYKQLREVTSELETLHKHEREAARRAEILSYQIEEIDSTHLKIGEDEELIEERNRLANAEGLSILSQEALRLLDEGDHHNPAITDLLGKVVDTLNRLAKIDPSQNETSTKAHSFFEEISDFSRNIRDYLDEIEFNPKRLIEVEERIESIQNLKRKYGESIEAILAFADEGRQELESITNAEARIQELTAEREKLHSELAIKGWKLFNKRKVAAAELAESIETELNDLRMVNARFLVSFERRPDPDGIQIPDGERVAFDINGLERVEFMIETNPGEGFKPLVKIASGGETARLMLALKNVLATADHVPTLIFDEIDQGIGGRVGSVVGRKLWQLSNQHQVLCITHLPQLAAYGQQHYQVQKDVKEGRTTTKVEQVEGEARLNELALMLGEVSMGTLKSAQEILQLASKTTTH